MSWNLKTLALAGVACLLTAAPLAAQSPQFPEVPQAIPVVLRVNDTARLLAGLPPAEDSPLLGLTGENSWRQHAGIFDQAWAKLEERQLSKVRQWARSEVPDAFHSTGTAFYMFSGPDFLYADTFFPRAGTYVLCGIEPIGPLPDLSRLVPAAIGGELRALRNALDSVLSFSFFITKEMKNDLRNHKLSGTLPILYIFLARSGKTVSDVSFVSIDAEGVLGPHPDGIRSAQTPAPGVCIEFYSQGSPIPQTLYYFSTDISDSGLKRSGFLTFCQNLAPGNSCIKSASYLMHQSYFSRIRAFLLENTSLLVQDDSGIPCSFFEASAWQLRFFGSYPGPIPLFKEYRQQQLADFYRNSQPAPLDFGIGYRHRPGESTLMVATRKSSPHGAESGPLPVVPIPRDEAPPRARIVPEPVPDAASAAIP